MYNNLVPIGVITNRHDLALKAKSYISFDNRTLKLDLDQSIYGTNGLKISTKLGGKHFLQHWVVSWIRSHEDVIKWKHFPRNWPFVRGIHRSSPVNSPHKGQWRGALMFSLICVWINDRVNNRKAGDLRRHRAHYDVIVMTHNSSQELYNRFAFCCVLLWLYAGRVVRYYRQFSNISRTKHQNIHVPRLVSLLSLPNQLKSVVKLRMTMWLEQRRQAMLQLHLSDQQFYCLLRCVLY